MALILTANETEFAPCPSGSHHATCIRIIDLGTQRIEYNGEVKTQPKILIPGEILSQNDPDMQMSDGRPYIISRRYTASMHSKSQLANDLKSWRGRDFSPEERAGFDIRNVLGKTCLLSVSHERFNSQPREGGWSHCARSLTGTSLFQLTAARRRLAESLRAATACKRFNSQPREGGWA